MGQNDSDKGKISEYESIHSTVIVSERLKPFNIILPALVIAVIIAVMCVYTHI